MMMCSISTAMMIVLLSVILSEATGDYMIYKDPKQSVDERIKDLMKRMNLQEKVGQMTQIERKNANPIILNKYFIGSVISGGGSSPSSKASAEEWVKMVNDLQEGALSTRLGIPIFYGADAIHGHNNVYNATIFPHNVGLGATSSAIAKIGTKTRPSSEPWNTALISDSGEASLSTIMRCTMKRELRNRDPALVKRIGEATALEVRATGIQYNFAPGLAVCRDPRWGQCYESYSEDPKLVRAMTEIIPGMQGDVPTRFKSSIPFLAEKTKVATCAKYFVGDGGTVHGIDGSNTKLDLSGLYNIHMPPYLDAIRKGVVSIMVGYSSWNGKKMHANHDLITDFLKNKLKFKGFVISGWGGIDRITDPPHSNYSYSVQTSILAGIDMVMVPDTDNFTEFIDNLIFQVKKDIIPMSRIDDAVERILRVKFTMGLFENPFTDLSLANQLGSRAHRNLAREAVRRSLVLLKNGKCANQPLLPLKKKVEKVLVAGTHADDLGYQCGGWTVEWQGVKGNARIVGTTILNAIKKTVDPSTQVFHIENPDVSQVKSQKFSYAIVVVGEVPYAEGFGDSKNLTAIEPGSSTIRNVCGVVRCIVIVVSGRPVTIEPYLEQIDALVAAWLPGTEGQGVTDVLFGDYGFTGKLARTWFKSVEQLPMNVGDPHYDPLFPFGFGLTTKPRQGI